MLYHNDAPPPNPPYLLELIPVVVLKTFCVHGQPVEIGSTVSITRHDAESLKACGKCSF